MSKDETVRIAINLKQKIRDQFLEIQDDLGITNRTDVLRFLIKWYHKNQIKKGEG